MQKRFVFFPLLFSMLAACAPESEDVQPSKTLVKTEHAVVDQGEPNWLIIGGSAVSELVGGTDGEPDVIHRRFVMDALPVNDAASGHGQWVVVGEGTLQALGDDGQRARETRNALMGESIQFVREFTDGWIIGGGAGRLQLLDMTGEPAANETQVLSNSVVVDASYNGVDFLALGANGNVVRISAALALPVDPVGQTVFAAETPIAVVSNGDTNVDPDWIAFSDQSYAEVNGAGFPTGGSGALPGSATTVTYADGAVFVGLSDGSVARSDYTGTLTFSTQSVIDSPVTRIVKGAGTQLLVVGLQGKARLIESATGNPIGNIAQLDDLALLSAHDNQNGWWIVGDDSVIRLVDSNLANPNPRPEFLGEIARAVDVGASGSLVVGENGAFQLVDELGATVTVEANLGPDALNDVSWNGETFLVVGENGFSQRVTEQGEAIGDPTTLLDGGTIEFASWSGEFWIVGGAGGKYQIVRTDGQPAGQPAELGAIVGLTDAQWDGARWMVVGYREVGPTTVAIFAFVDPDPNVAVNLVEYSPMTRFDTVGFDGREWYAAGPGGLGVRISSAGQAMGNPVDVLDGNDVRAVYYNGQNFMVVGANGAMRRLGADFTPLRTTLSVVQGTDAAGVVWTEPRGFPNGPCLTNDLCFSGPCVGGLTTGRCCDSACDRACESCFQSDTDQPDGTCAPVALGRRPPEKPGGTGCEREPEATCGLTGFCDGAGDCQFFDDTVECQAASCSSTNFTPAGACDGSGGCDIPAGLDCSPYTGCTESGCATSCAADADCVAGYECDGTECVEISTDMEPEPEPEPTDDGGCCATAKPQTPSFLWALLVLGLLGIRRRQLR